MFIHKEADGVLRGLSCGQWPRAGDAMAGIAHVAGEVTEGRMLANLSAAVSSFSFLSPGLGGQLCGQAIISIPPINTILRLGWKHANAKGTNALCLVRPCID